ncbi:hypothetical protein GCM10009846_24310 [Agrococcus versicolor]|uniref:Secreted protein n=1 Tax=Agrococcus versicolor TaxID=501482 RepID=A0ABN3AVQ3_9MICO
MISWPAGAVSVTVCGSPVVSILPLESGAHTWSLAAAAADAPIASAPTPIAVLARTASTERMDFFIVCLLRPRHRDRGLARAEGDG